MMQNSTIIKYMQSLQRLDVIITGLKQLRLVMLILSIALLIITFFYSTVTLLEGVVITAFSLLAFCQKELSVLLYRYFILILMVAMIFDAGGFLQYIGQKNVALSASYIVVKVFNIVTLFIMLVIVWRHLQFYELLSRFELQQQP